MTAALILIVVLISAAGAEIFGVEGFFCGGKYHPDPGLVERG
jgi:hypothetical protein